MTASEFFTKYNGKAVDWDHYYGYQCVDLAQYYNYEVISAPPLIGNAKDIWNTYPQAYYTKIVNSPTNVPLKGDVVIWGSGAGGGYGHIAVFYQGDMYQFTSFDQNWNGAYCHFQPHNYNYILGWLHPTKSVSTPPTVPSNPMPQTDREKIIKELVNGSESDAVVRIKIRALF
jgi:hypothetical protein